MRAVNIMFDSLNKEYLSAYGCDWTHTPNFLRLAEKTARFNRAYVGSMPCMPARREMHTGRYNFLHRSWGPLEPFDRSTPEILSSNGVYTHCSTDHAHYWQDGGLTYHNRYDSCDMIRGQEGDWWKAEVDGFENRFDIRRQDVVNRKHRHDETDHPHVQTYLSGMEFLKNNKDSDNWFLQLEYFDPHEPFTAPERFFELYNLDNQDNDWPSYAPTEQQTEGVQKEGRLNYAAALSMCDHYLGKVLDYFDEHNLWEDTLLIVNTDHGFLLGEHGLFGKNYMPTYNDIANVPLFIWDPRSAISGEERNALVQTIDIPATLLGYFGIDKPAEMHGKDLVNAIENDGSVRNAALFGYFGKHINVTDGDYVYMRAAQNENNSPLYNYTLMPSHLFVPFSTEEMEQADDKLYRDFSFTQQSPVMKINANHDYMPKNSCYDFNKHVALGDVCIDVRNGTKPLILCDDEKVKTRLLREMFELMQENDAPPEQYLRVDLPYKKESGNSVC